MDINFLKDQSLPDMSTIIHIDCPLYTYNLNSLQPHQLYQIH